MTHIIFPLLRNTSHVLFQREGGICAYELGLNTSVTGEHKMSGMHALSPCLQSQRPSYVPRLYESMLMRREENIEPQRGKLRATVLLYLSRLLSEAAVVYTDSEVRRELPPLLQRRGCGTD